jgi:hypothetical protein
VIPPVRKLVGIFVYSLFSLVRPIAAACDCPQRVKLGSRTDPLTINAVKWISIEAANRIKMVAHRFYERLIDARRRYNVAKAGGGHIP